VLYPQRASLPSAVLCHIQRDVLPIQSDISNISVRRKYSIGRLVHFFFKFELDGLGVGVTAAD
jgi:hypothetical protein